jgi:hypothetical protein
MTRRMYDSTAAADIPADAKMVAGYLPPSRYAWSAADWARFPHAVKVHIAIFATVDAGHVLDVEQGDATPAQVPGWVSMRRKAGADPTVYCSQSVWQTCRDACARAGVAEPHWWIARYDNNPTIPAGAIAKQYANQTYTGRHYDLSVVADYWPGVDKEGELSWIEEIENPHVEDPNHAGHGVRAQAKDVLWEGTDAAQGALAGVQRLEKALAGITTPEVDYAKLAALVLDGLAPTVAIAVADELDKRARDNDPATGPRT